MSRQQFHENILLGRGQWEEGQSPSQPGLVGNSGGTLYFSTFVTSHLSSPCPLPFTFTSFLFLLPPPHNSVFLKPDPIAAPSSGRCLSFCQSQVWPRCGYLLFVACFDLCAGTTPDHKAPVCAGHPTPEMSMLPDCNPAMLSTVGHSLLCIPPPTPHELPFNMSPGLTVIF